MALLSNATHPFDWPFVLFSKNLMLIRSVTPHSWRASVSSWSFVHWEWKANRISIVSLLKMATSTGRNNQYWNKYWKKMQHNQYQNACLSISWSKLRSQVLCSDQCTYNLVPPLRYGVHHKNDSEFFRLNNLIRSNSIPKAFKIRSHSPPFFLRAKHSSNGHAN